MSEKIYIIAANRSPFVNAKGPKKTEWDGGDGKEYFPNAYSLIGSDKLLSNLFVDLMGRLDFNPEDFADVKVGCVSQYAGQGGNIARIAALESGIPEEVPAVTINRLCGSSEEAIISGAEMLLSQQHFKNPPKAVLIGGVEKLSEYPIDEKLFFPSPDAAEYLTSSQGVSMDSTVMARTAENLIEHCENNFKKKISMEDSRLEQDIFSYFSHLKATAAQEAGRFDKEIVPMNVEGNIVDKDIGPRKYNSSDEALKQLGDLKPIPNLDFVTPGNSSQTTDGASAMILVTESYMKNKGYEPLAEIYSWGTRGTSPDMMGWGPVPSTKHALDQVGLTLDDIGVIEINEAFAAQCLAVLKYGYKEDKWNIKNRDDAFDYKCDFFRKVNPNGGAIALGHPLGATGIRISETTIYEMLRRNAEFSLSMLCIGTGQGSSLIFRNSHFNDKKATNLESYVDLKL